MSGESVAALTHEALAALEAATTLARSYAYESPTDALTAYSGELYGRLAVVRDALREVVTSVDGAR